MSGGGAVARQYYSVDQVAALLGLHVKTVRAYVRDGRLKATRIGKQYRIAREDLEAFTGNAAPSTGRGGGPYAEASTIVRIDGIDREAVTRLTTTVMAAIAHGPDGDGRMRVEAVYDEERANLKVVILGGLDSTAELIKIIDVLVGEAE
ncbi:helix-turn-helix domain-containing protein [Sphaerimonospora thailandensis]|uniref:helix-turn-helix domain-containing protein n=1 Tax=Sphaerimonospora thailandensis TaxID=795644 RepID=UPI0027E592B0|nr:helix-turn-helix domain-containing protein [Sphaerimonospora thailandensis]